MKKAEWGRGRLFSWLDRLDRRLLIQAEPAEFARANDPIFGVVVQEFAHNMAELNHPTVRH